MTVLLYHDRFKSSLKQVSYSPMPDIESLGIDTIQLPHPHGNISIGGLNEEMVIILHQTVGMANPVIPANNLLKGI
jgi:hypothetical protein